MPDRPMVGLPIPFAGPNYARCSRRQRRLARRAVLEFTLMDEPGMNDAALGWARAAARVTLLTAVTLLGCTVFFAVRHDPRWVGFLLVTLVEAAIAVRARHRFRGFHRLVDTRPGSPAG